MLYQRILAFTLIELLIAIAIVGILMTIAIPSYQKYTRKAHYTEIVQAAAPYRLGIEECYQTEGSLNNCQAGKNGVPENIASGEGNGLIDNIFIEENGKIIITPNEQFGITAEDTFELTPSEKNGQLIWASSGGGVSNGYAN